jgi:hypothetical protein
MVNCFGILNITTVAAVSYFIIFFSLAFFVVHEIVSESRRETNTMDDGPKREVKPVVSPLNPKCDPAILVVVHFD